MATYAKILGTESKNFADKNRYFSAIKIEYIRITILTRVIELEDGSHASNVNMFFVLKSYLSHIEKMYETMNEDADSMFFYYSHNMDELIEYFNGLYPKVYNASKEEIKKITSQLQEGGRKAKEIRGDAPTG